MKHKNNANMNFQNTSECPLTERRSCCATSQKGVALKRFDMAGSPVYAGQFLGGGCLTSPFSTGGGVMFFILHRGPCCPNFDQGGGGVAPTVSLHCFLFLVSK